MTYATLIVSFLILIVLVIAGVQNTSPVQVRFMAWAWETSLSEIILWAAVSGAGIVAFLSLPKLSRIVLRARRLRKEATRLEALCRKSI